MSPETPVRSPSKGNHVKVLKFDDIPEVQVFEVAGKKHEPNRKLTCPTKSSVLHVLDQPLPKQGEIDIEIDEKSEPCATSDASFPVFHRRLRRNFQYTVGEDTSHMIDVALIV